MSNALIDELREMIETNINVDWDVQDAADEFKMLLEYIDKRKPKTDVHVAIEMYKGLVNDVQVSMRDFEDTAHPAHIASDELYDEGTDSGTMLFVTDLVE